jgi:CheY-like chemotaxis protein
MILIVHTMLHTPVRNTEIALLENSTPQQLLDLFESCLRTRSKVTEYGKMSVAWGILFSSLYLSNMELESEMQNGIHRLSEDKESMLREFIRTDCENGGTFVMNVIKTGGTIDRSALIMIADLENLARIEQDGTTAIHILAKACDKGVRPALISRAGKQLLANVFDRNGIPVIFSIIGMSNLTEQDLVALETTFSKDDLKKVMAKNRMGRNALEAFTEVATTLRDNLALKHKTFLPSHPSTMAKNVAVAGVHTVPRAPPDTGTDPLAGKGRIIPPVPGKISLPETPQPGTPMAIDAHDASNKKLKIMIVDDDEIIRGLLQIRLKILGYEQCIMAESGDDAVTLAEATRPDVVFMDISMPGKLDGIAAAGKIKAHANARIIFLTGFCDQEILHRAKEIHPDGYIVKPFNDMDLRVSLKVLM